MFLKSLIEKVLRDYLARENVFYFQLFINNYKNSTYKRVLKIYIENHENKATFCDYL